MKLRYAFAIAILFITTGLKAQEEQLPNGSFETWQNGLPAGWVGVNLPGFEIITQSNESHSGSFAVQGETKTSPFGGMVMPAMLMTGTPDPSDPTTYIPGFRYTSKPSSLTGYIKTDLAAGDTLVIVVGFMTANGDTVGGGAIQISQDMPNYAEFTVPLKYNSLTPDTAVIAIMAGMEAPLAGTKFWVDDLSFSNTTADVRLADAKKNLTVLYSESQHVDISFNNENAVQTTLDIVDVHGRVVETLHEGVAGSAAVRWQTNGVARGIYFARLTRPNDVITKKIMIAH